MLKEKLYPKKKQVNKEACTNFEKDDFKALFIAASSVLLPVAIVVVVFFGLAIWLLLNMIK